MTRPGTSGLAEASVTDAAAWDKAVKARLWISYTWAMQGDVSPRGKEDRVTRNLIGSSDPSARVPNDIYYLGSNVSCLEVFRISNLECHSFTAMNHLCTNSSPTSSCRRANHNCHVDRQQRVYNWIMSSSSFQKTSLALISRDCIYQHGYPSIYTTRCSCKMAVLSPTQ